jgi:hypothetical protein
MRKIQTHCSDESGGETSFVSKDTYTTRVAGEYGFNAPSAKCGPMKNTLLAFPGAKFLKFCRHVFLYCISFSIVLSFVRTVMFSLCC